MIALHTPSSVNCAQWLQCVASNYLHLQYHSNYLSHSQGQGQQARGNTGLHSKPHTILTWKSIAVPSSSQEGPRHHHCGSTFTRSTAGFKEIAHHLLLIIFSGAVTQE